MLISCHSHAQYFGHVPTRWTYNDHDVPNHQNYPNTILSVMDTVVLGMPCHLVIGDCNCGTSQTNYVYEQNRKVYWYNYTLGTFSLLYDFNLDAGGTWTVISQNANGDSLTLRVDSVSYDTINGHVLKVQHVSTTAVYGHPYIFEGPVIEEIGSTFCLYPQYASCDMPSAGLRCFEDSVYGYYDTHLAGYCEEVFEDSGIGISDIQRLAVTPLSPNPFHVSAAMSIENISVSHGLLLLSDPEGRILEERSFSGNRIVIGRKNLENGIYFYHLQAEGASASGKFIID